MTGERLRRKPVAATNSRKHSSVVRRTIELPRADCALLYRPPHGLSRCDSHVRSSALSLKGRSGIHHASRVLVLAQSDKPRMPQPVSLGPFEEFDLSHGLWPQLVSSSSQ